MDVITFMVGILLLMVGVAFVLSPFPVGWIFISTGLLLMIMVSVTFRKFAKKEVEKHPRLEKRLPKKIKDMLSK